MRHDDDTRAARPPRAALPRFLLLYGALFAAFGVASPFVPALMGSRGLQPDGIGAALAAGTAVRLLTGPLGGRLADRTGRRRLVLGAFAGASALVALLYGPARGLLALMLVSVLHASVLAPLTPIADALAVAAATAAADPVPGEGPPPRRGGRGRFEYGWVRGAGSAAFVLGATLSGRAVGRFGLDIIIWLNAGLLGLATAAAFALPPGLRAAAEGEPARKQPVTSAPGEGFGTLLRLPWFPTLMAVAALVLGSHAMHDSFAVIRWRAMGVRPALVGVLWSEQVAAEVVVFLVLGRPLLDRLGTRGACILTAGAGVLRWSVTAITAAPAVLALPEPLHGLTFALLHLSVMRRLAQGVPGRLLATAQAFYATVATGAATAALTLLSGALYGRFGGHAFWFMAGLCAAALLLAAARLSNAPDAGAARVSSRDRVLPHHGPPAK